MPAIYVHIPFCQQRCWYCDFITYANKASLIPQYLEALLQEIRLLGNAAPETDKEVGSIFLGGGTPSLLQPAQVRAILSAIQQRFEVRPDAEITLEANPGTISLAKLQGYREAGVNRLSLGIQSFDDTELAAIGRIHNAKIAYESIELARQAGYKALSLDLIFGLPGQTLQSWEASLDAALAAPARHLSLYSLILEEGTFLASQVAQGAVNLPEDDLTAGMYELAREKLAAAGWKHYEISNWALSAADESRHNKIYWQQNDWLGFGVGAHGLSNGWQTANIETIEGFISAIGDEPQSLEFPLSPTNTSRLRVDTDDSMRTFMIFGLRLLEEGVSEAEFEQRFGQEMGIVFGREIERLLKRRLIEWVDFPDGPHLRLTHAAVPIGNQAFMEFVES